MNTEDTDKKKKITQIKTKIIFNKNTSSGYYKMLINAPEIAKCAFPGQFVNVRVNNSFEPFLRRPLSIHWVINNSLILLYKVVGKGTQILSGKKPGEYLDIVGPLGRGFSYQLPVTSYQLPVLVAGGIGVAPLVFLAEKLTEIKNKKLKIKNLVLIGARTKKEILCANDFKDLGCEVKIATDDGSQGSKGMVTDLLKDLLVAGRWSLGTIYACGPKPMLKEVSRISKQHNIPAQVCLEEYMACGTGVCLGCVVNTKSGYQRICADGPVFNAEDIVWEF